MMPEPKPNEYGVRLDGTVVYSQSYYRRVSRIGAAMNEVRLKHLYPNDGLDIALCGRPWHNSISLAEGLDLEWCPECVDKAKKRGQIPFPSHSFLIQGVPAEVAKELSRPIPVSETGLFMHACIEDLRSAPEWKPTPLESALAMLLSSGFKVTVFSDVGVRVIIALPDNDARLGAMAVCGDGANLRSALIDAMERGVGVLWL